MRHHRTKASTSDFTRSRARPRDAFDSVRFRSIPFDPFESIRSDRRARPRRRRRGPLTRYDPPPSRLDAPCQRIHAHTNAPAPFSRRHRRRARPAARSPRVPASAPRRALNPHLIPITTARVRASTPHSTRAKATARTPRANARASTLERETPVDDAGRRRRDRDGISSKMSAPTLASEIVDAVRALPLAVSVPMALTTVTILVFLLDQLSHGPLKARGSPPVIAVAPVWGGMMEFLAGPMRLMKKAMPEYGEVFTVPVFHKRITFLIGPKVSEFFFKAKDTEMSQKEVYEFNVPTFGKGVVFDVDHATRAEQFRFFADSLKSNRLRMYVGMMVKEAEDFFAKWGDEGEVDLLEQLSELIVLTASRCLLGREIRETLYSEVTSLVHDLDKGMVPLSVFFPYAPIEAHRKRDAARKKLAMIFDKVIQARRESGASEPDVLQTFIDARYKDGSKLSNDQVLGMLIAVLFAGQHTSSITSTWTGLLSIANKSRVIPTLEEEQRKIMKEHGNNLDFDILAKMDELHFAVKEALRMHPPLIMLLRMAQVPFDVETSDGKKYTIPKGHIVATSPAFAHRLENVYSDPDVYNPGRFREPNPEDKAAFASFIGFGGGRHGCMGETFAYMQIKTIWSILLRNFDFELVGNLPEPDYEGMVVGPKKSCVRYKRRALK